MNTAQSLFGDQYRLGRLLGVGGSASVYQAQTGEGGQVALKVLHPHLCSTAAARQAFLREAGRLGQVRHPNVAAVHDFGLHDAGGVLMPWIALDLVSGPTLSQRIAATGPLPPQLAVAVMNGILAGLGAAHECGLVHRDVTPGNVILASADFAEGPIRSEMVRLIDFGLADAAGRTTLGSDLLLANTSAPTSVVGNLAYLSPEQAQGLPVSAAGDLYQAGAVLYFLLTGQPPFPRDSAASVLRAHLCAPPPVPSALARTPASFDQIVTTAMAKQPGERYQGAAAFSQALASALNQGTIGQPHRSVCGEGSSYRQTRLLPAAESLQPTMAPRRLLAEPSGTKSTSLSYLTSPALGSGQSEETMLPAGRNSAASIAVAALAGVAVLAVLSAFTSTGTAARPTLSASQTPAAAPVAAASPSAQSTISTARVEVPTLHGQLSQAEAALNRSGLRLGQVSRSDSAEPVGTVLGQSPDPGELVPADTAVNLVTASGANTVPKVTGMNLATAVAALESAGFKVSAISPTTDPTTLVAGCQPKAGTRLRLGVRITVVLPTLATLPTRSPSPTQVTPSAPNSP